MNTQSSLCFSFFYQKALSGEVTLYPVSFLHKPNAQSPGAHAQPRSEATRFPPRATPPHSPSAGSRGLTAASGRSSTLLPGPPVPPRLQPARARLAAGARLGASPGGAEPRRSQFVPASAPRRSVVALATRERQRRRRGSPAPPLGRPAVGSGRLARAVPASWPALAGQSERPPVRGSRPPFGRAQLAGATMPRWSCRRGASTGTRLPGRPGRPARRRRH